MHHRIFRTQGAHESVKASSGTNSNHLQHHRPTCERAASFLYRPENKLPHFLSQTPLELPITGFQLSRKPRLLISLIGAPFL